MEERKCSFCGKIVTDVIKFELEDGDFICLKCYSKMSKGEQVNLQEKMKLEEGVLSQGNIDALLNFADGGEDQENIVLRIVSWNCHYGLNVEKYLKIMQFYPQILLIQECRKADFDYIKNLWKYKNWYCDDLYTDESEYGSENGVAIFSNNYKIEFTEIFNRKYRYIIPYKVSNNEQEFTIFSVWVKPVNKNYLKPLYESVKYYQDKKMFDAHSLLIGDYNAFAKDKKDLEALEENLKPLINCAKKTDEIWTTSTYYHGNNNYGINDFCFSSIDICDNVKISIPFGWDKTKSKDYHWKGLSDHSPIIIDIIPNITNLSANYRLSEEDKKENERIVEWCMRQ
jgi:hypothetical protein